MNDEQPGQGGVPPGLSDINPDRVQMIQTTVQGHWGDVMDDLFATAEEYEEMGWETVTVRPGDVTVVTDETIGDHVPIFAVTCPQSAWDPIDELFEDGITFDRSEVFQAAVNEVVFIVVALEAETEETAVLYPVYYSMMEWGPAYNQNANDAVYTRLRHIDGRFHQVEHDNPELFAPPDDMLEEDDQSTEDTDHPEGGWHPPDEPPEPADRPYDDLTDCTPEQLSELSLAEIRAYSPEELTALDKEQRQALTIPRGNTDDE